jgi:hypothetical protein
VPLIKDLLDQLLRGKLKDTLYPNVVSKDQPNQQSQSQQGQQMIKYKLSYLYILIFRFNFIDQVKLLSMSLVD